MPLSRCLLNSRMTTSVEVIACRWQDRISGAVFRNPQHYAPTGFNMKKALCTAEFSCRSFGSDKPGCSLLELLRANFAKKGANKSRFIQANSRMTLSRNCVKVIASSHQADSSTLSTFNCIRYTTRGYVEIDCGFETTFFQFHQPETPKRIKSSPHIRTGERIVVPEQYEEI